MKILFCRVSVCVQVLQLWRLLLLHHWLRPNPSIGWFLLRPERRALFPIEHHHVSRKHQGGQESKHLVVEERRQTAGQKVRGAGSGEEEPWSSSLTRAAFSNWEPPLSAVKAMEAMKKSTKMTHEYTKSWRETQGG